MPALLRAFLRWLPLAAGLTMMSILVYATVQQNYRQSANDPQLQLAGDIATALANGVEPTTIVPNTKFEMNKSLSPFVIIFDQANKVIAANVQLDGQTPVPPVGALNVARKTGENRLTWQPKVGVRSATVSVSVKNNSGQVVMVGRSLREVEDRESQLALTVLGAWVVSLLGTLVATVVLSMLL